MEKNMATKIKRISVTFPDFFIIEREIQEAQQLEEAIKKRPVKKSSK